MAAPALVLTVERPGKSEATVQLVAQYVPGGSLWEKDAKERALGPSALDADPEVDTGLHVGNADVRDRATLVRYLRDLVAGADAPVSVHCKEHRLEKIRELLGLSADADTGRVGG